MSSISLSGRRALGSCSSATNAMAKASVTMKLSRSRPRPVMPPSGIFIAPLAGRLFGEVDQEYCDCERKQACSDIRSLQPFRVGEKRPVGGANPNDRGGCFLAE